MLTIITNDDVRHRVNAKSAYSDRTAYMHSLVKMEPGHLDSGLTIGIFAGHDVLKAHAKAVV